MFTDDLVLLLRLSNTHYYITFLQKSMEKIQEHEFQTIIGCMSEFPKRVLLKSEVYKPPCGSLGLCLEVPL